MALMKLSAGQQWKHRHRERSCVDSGGRRGLDKLRKWHGNIYTTMCEIVSGKLLYSTGNSAWCSVMV